MQVQFKGVFLFPIGQHSFLCVQERTDDVPC